MRLADVGAIGCTYISQRTSFSKEVFEKLRKGRLLRNWRDRQSASLPLKLGKCEVEGVFVPTSRCRLHVGV